ncbi:MAG: cupin domain-containing protein [bacterium]|nr:cupin domain-containing protein [bacterium]
MSDRNIPRELIRVEDRKDLDGETYSHPLNPNSEISGVSLSELAGMKRVGVHLVRVKPGKEAFVYHSHACEEEFIYILSGHGIAEVGDQEFEVGPGDFLGFPTPSVAHHLRNPSEDDLVYLMGGERKPLEIADFPRLGKRIIRMETEAQIANIRDFSPFWKRDSDGE